MKKIFTLLVALGFAGCQHMLPRDPAQQTDAAAPVSKEVKSDAAAAPSIKSKTYFKTMPESERMEAIRKARVTNPDYDLAKVPSVDIVADLEAKCGPTYTYQKTVGTVELGSFDRSEQRQFDMYSWPKKECEYHQDTGKLGGGTEKFYCDFKDGADSEEDDKTTKVKYAKSPEDPLHSEILETILATTITRLLGFYADYYCPAQVTCKNCPSSNPWKDKRSSQPPSSKSYVFPVAIVESVIKGSTMSSRLTHPYVQGIEWYEMREIQGANPEETRSLAIEREARMLWLNFIQHADAGSFNERLSCIDSKKDASGKPVCRKSIMYTHDFGWSFYRHFNFSKWASHPPFQKNEKGQACIGNMTTQDLGIKEGRVPGLVFSPAISSEARDLLVQRLEQISDLQWLTAFQLAHLEAYSQATGKSFLDLVKKKIGQMKSADCLPFDTHTSVLAAKNPVFSK